MFANIDLSAVPKKVLDNPKLSIGAASVALAALIYAVSKSTANAIDDEIDTLPEYAKQDIDPEFTLRFGGNRNRKRTISNDRTGTIGKSLKNGKHHKHHQEHIKEESKDDDEESTTYSVFDANNPNYKVMLEEEEEEQVVDDEEEIGFSTDQYYVPFTFQPNKTKRKPDHAFVAMLQLYGSGELKEYESNKKRDLYEMEDEEANMQQHHHHHHVQEEEEEEHGGADIEEKTSSHEQEAVKEAIQDPELDSLQPFLSGSQNGNSTANTKSNGLQSLKERYYKRQLPSSLHPDTLTKSFQSTEQVAIQNDLNADDSWIGGIKQSVHMITKKSND